MRKNGLIAIISILAAVAGAVAAIFAITKKIGKKQGTDGDAIADAPDHIEIDIEDEDDYGITEEEYQSESAEIPQQDIEEPDESEQEQSLSSEDTEEKQ